MSPARRAILGMVVFVALWAALEAFAARTLAAFSPYQVVFMRYVVHLAFMAVVWGWHDPAALWRTRRPVFQVARSLLMLAMPASFIMSIQHGVGTATLLGIFWLSPLMILVFAALFLGERVPLAVWMATAVGWIAALVIISPPELAMRRSLVLPVVMALSFSLYVVMTRSLRTDTTRANLFYTALGVAFSLAPVMPRVWIVPGPVELLSMIVVGLLGFVALYALDHVAAAAPVHVAAPAAYLQVAFTVAIGLAIHAPIGRRVLAGLAVMGAIGVYVWGREPRGDVQVVAA